MLQPMERPLAQARTLVRRLHDAGTRAGDDREAGLGEKPRDFLRALVLRIVGAGARRAEDRDALLNIRQRIESLDELAHDAQDAPRIGPREVIEAAAWLLQQLLVLGNRGVGTANRVVHFASRARAPQCRRLRRRSAASLEVPLLGPLAQPLERVGSGVGHHPRIGLLSRRGARTLPCFLSGARRATLRTGRSAA